MTTGLPSPVPFEIQLLQDKLVRVQDKIDNIPLTERYTLQTNLYQSKIKINKRIHTLSTLQGRSRSVPRSYCEESNKLAIKHSYLLSLDSTLLTEFPDSIVYNCTSWDNPYLPNIHVVQYLQSLCPPLSLIAPPDNDPPHYWGQERPSPLGWGQIVDLSYRQPLFGCPGGWDREAFHKESWARVRKTLFDIHDNTNFGHWKPILDTIETYLYN